MVTSSRRMPRPYSLILLGVMLVLLAVTIKFASPVPAPVSPIDQITNVSHLDPDHPPPYCPPSSGGNNKSKGEPPSDSGHGDPASRTRPCGD